MKSIVFLVTISLCFANTTFAEIANSSADGFQISIERALDCDATTAYSNLVDDFSEWYDTSHSYSQDPKNLSLDLERHCMYEKLPDGGFVRHMEIVFHQPGKMLRMTGGLGPLQGMGISGAMTFSFAEVKSETGDEKSKVVMTYIVTGADFLQLDKIAVPVNQVLDSQLDRFQKFCASEF